MAESASAASAGQVFSRLMRLLRPYWGRIVLGMILQFLSAPCEIFPGLVWMYVVDTVVLGKRAYPWLQHLFTLHGLLANRYALLASAVICMLVVYLLGEIIGTLETWLLNRVAQRFILGLRNTVYHKIQGQSLGYLQRQRTGDLMSRAMGDIDEVQSFIVNAIDVIFGEGLLWLETVAIVMWLDWRLASISLAPLVVVYFLLRYFNRKIQPIYIAARQRLGDVSARLQENLSGIVVIKIFAREKQEAARFEKATRDYYDRQIDAVNARSLFFPVTRFVGFFSNIFMIGVGGWFMLRDIHKSDAAGLFTPGKLVAFRSYWWRLFGPISTLARVNDMVQRAAAAARRVFEVLDAPEELPDAPGAAVLSAVRGELEFKDVSFQYPAEPGFEGAPIVLHHLTLQIPAGKKVALCGPSGAGKSTILNLLLRFYDPSTGAVCLDGCDLRCVARDSFRRYCALVQQEAFLFNDSIFDNIRYGHGEATMEQVVAAAKAANAHGFISALPNGYDTKVGERGVRLSGGQKQRITIARAFLANPCVLLLDEPTSSVEPDSEAAIVAALDRLMRGRTTVLTSHRPSLINQADWVYVIENGRITESGPPQELRNNRDGWFGRFIRSAEGLEFPDEQSEAQKADKVTT